MDRSKFDIFISYSRQDFDEVNAMVSRIKEAIPWINIWFDVTGIESGDEFQDKIVSAIDNSSIVLFAISDSSINKSAWTKNEVRYAKKTSKRIIPVLLKGAELKKGWFLFEFVTVDCIDIYIDLQWNKLIKNLSEWFPNQDLVNPHDIDTPKDAGQASNPMKMSPEEMLYLGNTHYGTENYAEAVKWYRKAAEQGNAVAQNNMGWCYANGIGVDQDYAEAAKWYRKAAEQGEAAAQSNLGWCYENGKGVAQDYAEAVKWYRLAAEQGNAIAQNIMGGCYAKGEGVDRDFEEAVMWWRRASEQGYAIAQNNLGGCYANGIGVDQDYAEAVKWYCKAVEQGDELAMKKLMELDEEINNQS
jgi:tetratricopeptide (TPR) repeat protein